MDPSGEVEKEDSRRRDLGFVVCDHMETLQTGARNGTADARAT